MLSACITGLNSSDDNALLNKTMSLESPRYLSQTRYMTWLNTQEEVNTIERPGDTKGCLPEQNCVPSLNEFQHNSILWQNWHVRKNTQYRIVAVLPKNTLFHFYKIDVPDQKNSGVFFFYSKIDSGTYKNIQAYYKYDKNYSSDLRLINDAS